MHERAANAFQTRGTIADGRVGGSKFLNMHNTRSTLQNSAGGAVKVAFMMLKMLQTIVGSRSQVRNRLRREDETFVAPFCGRASLKRM